MAHFPRAHRQVRAPRVRVPNDESVSIKTEGKDHKALLRVLSTTGGCLEIQRPLEEGTLAEIMVQTATGPIAALIEMLYPRQRGTQPFRFVAIPDGEYQRLDSTLQRMRRQGSGI